MTSTAVKPSFYAVVRALLPVRYVGVAWQVLAAAGALVNVLYGDIALGAVTFEMLYVLVYIFVCGYGPMHHKTAQALTHHLCSLSVPVRRTEWAHVAITLVVPVVLALGALVVWPFAADGAWRSPLALFAMTPALAIILSAEDIGSLHTLRGRAFFRAVCVKVGLYVGWFVALYTVGNHWATCVPAVAITLLAGWNLRYVIRQKMERHV